MNDITYCSGKKCPQKLDCFRFTAKVYGKRDFFVKAPFNQNTNKCNHFLSNERQLEQDAYYLWLLAGKPENKSDFFWFKAKESYKK